jgi:hypothetical protein
VKFSSRRIFVSLRRISGSSSMTKIFSYRQPHSHYGSFTQFAFYVDFGAMQIDAALCDHQTETCTWSVIDVMPAMKNIEKPLAVGFWNSNALVADGVDHISADGQNFEPHRASGVALPQSIYRDHHSRSAN